MTEEAGHGSELWTVEIGIQQLEDLGRDLVIDILSSKRSNMSAIISVFWCVSAVRKMN